MRQLQPNSTDLVHQTGFSAPLPGLVVEMAVRQ